MSILRMKKLTLIGASSEKDKIFTAFSRSKKVHLIQMDQLDDTHRELDVEEKDELIKKMSRVNDSIMYVKRSLDVMQNQLRASGDKKTKVAVKLSQRNEVKFSDFDKISEYEQVLDKQVLSVTEASKLKMAELDAEIAKLKQSIKSLEIYSNLDVKFSQVKDTDHTTALLGVCGGNVSLFDGLVTDFPDTQFALIDSNSSGFAIYAIALKENLSALSARLSELNFSRCGIDIDSTAIDEIKLDKSLIEQKVVEKRQLFLDSCDLKEYLPRLQLLYDFYSIQLQLAETGTSICETNSTFVMQGWVLEREVDSVTRMIDKNLSVSCYDFTDPDESEKVPTVVQVPKVVQPFTGITDMYSLPDYRESDPNLFVAAFYWIFMGLMMGDVGYGLLMMLIAAAFVKFIKPEGGLRNVVLIIGYSGLSTMIWGVLFGGWFAIDFGDNPIFAPKLFSPLTNPLGMIEVCVILGTLHLMSGLIMKAINLFRQGKALDAVLDCFTWIVFEGGLICTVIGAFGGLTGAEGNFSLITNIGLYVMLGSLILIVLTAGRHNKGFGKVVGGLGGAWSVISLLSDILSYLRLFGLGLTTGVIGMVFNTLAGLLLGNPFSFVFGVVVLLFGHGMNLAINLLGAYVHDARLQHIEFFGKFYTGDGLSFKPIASETKYTKFINE